MVITLTSKKAIKPIAGDLDGSGTLDSGDVMALVCHLTGQETPEGFDSEAADVNGDNEVNIADVTALIDLILNRNDNSNNNNNENNNGDE